MDNKGFAITGILYTILFPFIVLIFIMYLVYVFFNYLVVESLTLFGFFFGYTFSTETELEKKLKEMKDEEEHVKEEVHNVSYEYDPSFDNEGGENLWVMLIF